MTRTRSIKLALAQYVGLSLVFLWGGFAVNAEEVQPAPSKYKFPSWVNAVVRKMVNLPPVKSPLEHTFAVKPGYEIHFYGEIAQASAKDFNARSGVFIINFYDANHNDVEQKALKYSSWLKGYLFYLGGTVRMRPFHFEVKVPERAVKAKIRLARLNPQLDDVGMVHFWWTTVNPNHAFRKMALVCCLFAFSLIVALRLRNKHKDDELLCCTASGAEENMTFKLWRFCVVTLAIIMTCVFFREVYAAIRFNPKVSALPLSVFLGFFMALIVLAALVCSIARNKAWLSIMIIMLICFIAHAIVIRLTHSLYSQSMFSDFLKVERVMGSGAVKIAHSADFSYWCNYELLCSFLSKLFCRNMQIAQYLNALCCVAAVYPVFKVSHGVGGHGMAVFTSLLMGLSPMTQIYGTLLSGEFISAAAYSWSVYSIVKMLEEQSLNGKSAYALWSGVFLGIGNLVKPIAVVFIIAAVMVVAIGVIRNRCMGVNRWLVILPLFLGTYILTYQGTQHVIIEIAKPQLIGASVDDEFTKRLLIGLNVETHGGFDLNWKMQWEYLPSEERLSLLKHVIKKGYRKFPSLFLEKLDRAYSNPGFVWSWYGRTIKTDVPLWVRTFVCIWNLVVLLSIAAGIMGFVVSGNIVKRRGFAAVVSLLVVAAFTVALVLMECQPRYKMAIYPVFFFLIPYARFLVDGESLMCRLVKRCPSGAVKMWERIARIVKTGPMARPARECDDGEM